MNNVPVQNGSDCVFRVVRVSGTMRKAQEELIRKAREMILKAQQETGEQGDATLDSIFGRGPDQPDSTKDIEMADRSDTEEEDELSDGD
jgi:ribonuclease P/MRP protein subunit POP5